MVSDYVGIPFLDCGMDRDKGLSCWGLVRFVYREEFGVDLPTYQGDTIHPDEHEMIEGMVSNVMDNGTWTSVPEPKMYDVVLMNFAKHPVHIGLYVETDGLLHTLPKYESVRERLSSCQWAKRVVGYWRHTSQL